MKIQTKTTLLFTVITSVFLLVLEGVVYYFINKAAQNDFNKRVELRAKISAKFRFEKGTVSTEAFQEIQREYLEKLPKEEAFVFETHHDVYPTADHLAHGITKAYIQQIIAADGETVFKQQKFRHFAGLLYKGETGDYVIIKSATNQYGRELMSKLRNIMISALIFSIVLSYLGGQYFAKRSFSPFRKMAGKVKQINENNLHLRLEETEGNDEIAELTATFNKMLDRIEMAFETQNNFISNASHELRTPLTAIAAEADYALTKERNPQEYQQSLQQISQQANKLKHLTHGLLSLAQTGFDGKKLIWETIRLDQLVYDVKENVDDIMPGNKVVVSVAALPEDETRMSISGSYDLLKVAFSNIVLNACKYSDNQPVVVELLFESFTASVIIKDKGIGIPSEELKHIYDPFFRASNTQQYEGYGIGMPLSRNIIRLHKGSIEVLSQQHKGTNVVIKLPLGSALV